MAIQGSKWSTKADLGLDIEALGKTDTPGDGKVNVNMGHFCYFEGLADTTKHATLPFDFPVMGDLTIIANPTGVNLDAALTIDMTMEGSIGGSGGPDTWTWIELADKTKMIQDSDGTIDEAGQVGVYDYDTYGRMPHMRLTIQGNTNCDSTYLIAVVPQ